MRMRYITPVAYIVLITSCSSIVPADSGQIINHELYLSYKNYKNTINKSRPELQFTNKQIASNCASYLDLSKTYALDETVYNQTVKSEYLICDAIKILHDSPLNQIYRSHKSNLAIKLAKRLDLTTFPSSLHMMSDDENHTLDSLYPNKASYKDSIVTLNTDDWSYRLEIVAIAKLNNNDIPDWIVWLSDESKSGNYRAYQSLIIYDPDDKKSLKAVSYPMIDTAD